MFEEKTVKLPVCHFPLQFNHQTLNFTTQLYITLTLNHLYLVIQTKNKRKTKNQRKHKEL